MKKLMFAFAAMLGSVAFVNAQTQDEQNNLRIPETAQQDEKVKIKAEELPAAIRTALESQDYNGWMIDAAYKHTATEMFEVQLKNGTEVKTVKFNKEGEKVD